METEHSSSKTPTSRPDDKQSRFSSADARLEKITQQLIALAAAFRETLTPECMAIYSESLSDLSEDQVRQSVGRAIRELKFFPRVAELRDLAGVAAKDTRNVEAEAAWKWANDYLRKWGVDLMPLWSNGKTIEAPTIPPRIEYAQRRIGGLRGLNQVTEESRPFMFRDFCEAYNLAPVADLLMPQLTAKFPIAEGQVKQLTDGVNMERPREAKPAEARFKPKAIPHQEPLTAAQCADQREMLKQQAAALLRQRATKPHSEDRPSPPCEAGSESQSRVSVDAQARA